jgi:hypothetical protein
VGACIICILYYGTNTAILCEVRLSEGLIYQTFDVIPSPVTKIDSHISLILFKEGMQPIFGLVDILIYGNAAYRMSTNTYTVYELRGVLLPVVPCIHGSHNYPNSARRGRSSSHRRIPYLVGCTVMGYCTQQKKKLHGRNSSLLRTLYLLYMPYAPCYS